MGPVLLSSVKAWLTKASKLVELNGCRIIKFQLRNKHWSNNQFKASFKTLVFNPLWNYVSEKRFSTREVGEQKSFCLKIPLVRTL